jgi:hypothetical protein
VLNHGPGNSVGRSDLQRETDGKVSAESIQR